MALGVFGGGSGVSVGVAIRVAIRVAIGVSIAVSVEATAAVEETVAGGTEVLSFGSEPPHAVIVRAKAKIRDPSTVLVRLCGMIPKYVNQFT